MDVTPFNQIHWSHNIHRNYEWDFPINDPINRAADVVIPLLQAFWPQNIFMMNTVLSAFSGYNFATLAYRAGRNGVGCYYAAQAALSFLATGFSLSLPLTSFYLIAARDLWETVSALKDPELRTHSALLGAAACCNLVFLATGAHLAAASCAFIYAGKKLLDAHRYKAEVDKERGNRAILPSLLGLASIAVACTCVHRGLSLLTFQPLRPPVVPLS